MPHINHHIWHPLPGFRQFGCTKCPAVKHYDRETGKYVYDKGSQINLYRAPSCNSIINCQHVDTKITAL